MPMSLADPVAGHRAKYDHLAARLSPEQAGIDFVGGSDPAITGFMELEVLRALKDMKGASVLDIGCGIGRLAKYLLEEDVSQYLGLDIIPEILQRAIDASKDHPNFKYAIVEEAKLPAGDASFDIVCGFSLITHLLDEEIFEYFLEARRALRPGGVAIFSFADLGVLRIREAFFKHSKVHRHGHGDLLRFTTRPVMQHFSEGAGFASISFTDGDANVVMPERRLTLIDGRPSPATGALGQSFCVMRS